MKCNAKSWFVFSLIFTFLFAYLYPGYSVYYRSISYDPLHAKPGFGTLYDRAPEEDEIGFLITGDWGMVSPMQAIVAKQMANHATRIRAQFVLSNGDNIYSWGVGSINDPRFTKIFELPFTQDNNFDQMPWYMAIGNHDRRGNVEAQIEYSKRNPRWVLPKRFYDFDLPAFDHMGVPPIKIIVLDTVPLVCSDIDEELTLSAINRVECESFFYSIEAREMAAKNPGMLGMEIYEQIHRLITLERREQLKWLDEVLANTEKGAMKIVVGHHAMESASLVHGSRPLLNAHLRPILKKHGVDLYICGHDHNLQHIHRRYEHLHHIVAGGGGFVTTAGSLHSTYDAAEYPGLLYGGATFGFVAAVATKDSLSMEFIDYFGNITYNTTIRTGNPNRMSLF